MRRIFLATLVIFASAVCAYSQTSTARKAIEATTRSFIEAFNKGDAAAVAQIYAADAKVLPPNDKIVEGRANIQAFWQGAIGAGLKLTSLTPTTITPAGNLLIETGKYVSTIPSGGATVTDEGKYVVVWRREGRNWKIIRDIFNSDKPAQ